MTASALLSKLAEGGLIITRRGSNIVISPRQAATPEIVRLVADNKPCLLEALPDLGSARFDPEVERRHLKVMEQLDANPENTYALYSEESANCYLITVGVRDRGTVELRVPKHKMDSARMVEILDRHNMH